jgi:hypothetical protein
MMIVGVASSVLLPEVQPAFIFGSVVRRVTWALITYPSGRTEPRIFTGTAVLPFKCPEGLRHAKLAQLLVDHGDYLGTVERLARHGFMKTHTHRARPIARLEWIAAPVASVPSA